jgi:hypothetical protein
MTSKVKQMVAGSLTTCAPPGTSTWTGWFLLSLLLLTWANTVQAQFTSTTKDGVVTITGYSGPGGDVRIPDTINGRPVTAIGESAFVFQLDMTQVTIPGSVTRIGDYAFLWCRNLLDVSFSSNLTHIGSFAFQGCNSLASFTVDPSNPTFASVDGVLFDKARTKLIQCPQQKSGSYSVPSSVTHIESRAFHLCANLESIRLPGSVTHMGIEVFIACSSLVAFEVEAENPVYSSLDGVLFDKGRTRLINWPLGVTGDYRIPNGVTRVEVDAFYGSRVSSVTVPSTVRAIGTGAFYNCFELKELYFLGDAPRVETNAYGPLTLATLYYLPGTAGWPKSIDGRPAEFWELPEPLILSEAPDFGPANEGFGFRISWAAEAEVVVEATADLSAPLWVPMSTNTLVNGLSQFIDRHWTNSSTRFYRVVSP